MPLFQFDPFPDLTTTRLKMRKLSTNDLPSISTLRSDPRMLKYLNRDAPTLSETAQCLDMVLQQESEHKTINWACQRADNGDFVGTICLWNIEHQNFRAELGYSVLPDQQGQGYMHEMISSTINFGFQSMRLHTISAYVNPFNMASVHLLEKHGFIKEGYLRHCTHYQGQFYDLAVYALISPIPHIL